jgi:type IX secretion system PorP/SprF family membrane protein
VKEFVLAFLMLMLSFLAKTQDIHWSQIIENPIFLNPANSGNHNASHRFVSSYKEQWRSVTKPFQTFSFSYDSRLQDKDFGISLVFLNDKVGDGAFRTFEFYTAPTYFIPLDKRKKHILSTSIQIGLNHRQFDFNQFYFDEQYNGVAYDQFLPITEMLNSEKRTNLNIGTGVNYSYTNQEDVLNLGFSLFNLNQPNQGFYGDKIKRDVRKCLNVSYNKKMNEKVNLIPAFIFQQQGKFQEILTGLNVRYQLNEKSSFNKAVQLGFYSRIKDAFIARVGIEYKAWNVGVSYDVNTSSLIAASNRRGGLELNIKYLLYLFKPKQIQYRVCPDYI